MDTLTAGAGSPEKISVVTQVTFMFFQYLIAAILVERTIEILVAVYKYVEMRRQGYAFWNRKAADYRGRFERLFGYNEVHPSEPDRHLSWLLWKTMVPTPTGVKDVIAADMIRTNYMRVATRTIALLFSVVLVYASGLDPKVILVNIIGNIKEIGFFSPATEWFHVRCLLLAVLISAGSEPLHQAIGAIEKYAQSNGTTKKGGVA